MARKKTVVPDADARETTDPALLTSVDEAIANWSLLRDAIHEFEADNAAVFETHRAMVSAYNSTLESIKASFKEFKSAVKLDENFSVQVRTSYDVDLAKLRPYLSPALLSLYPKLITEVKASAIVADAPELLIQNPEWISKVDGTLVNSLVTSKQIPFQEGLVTKIKTPAAYVPKPFNLGE